MTSLSGQYLMRANAFELWCWRRLLRVPWTARRSNLSILKEISPRCSFEGLMLKLKLQYFCYLMWSVDSLENILMLGGIVVRRRRGWQWMTWLDGIIDSIDMSWWVNSRSWWWTGRTGMLWFTGSQRVGHDWATKLNEVIHYLKTKYSLCLPWSNWTGCHEFFLKWLPVQSLHCK